MRDYKWDLQELNLRKKQLIQEKNRINSFNKKICYEEAIQIYQLLISEYQIKSLVNLESDNSDDKKISLDDFYSSIFCETNPFIINFLAKNIKFIEDKDPKLKYSNYKLLGIPNKDLIEIVHNIYKTIPSKEIYSKFLDIINPNNHLLDIEYCPFEYSDYEGICRIDAINHIAYGKVLRSNTIQDIFTLAHEIMHMIVRQNEKSLFLFENRRYYSEYEGIFMNFIVTDYLLKQGFDKDDITDISILEYLGITCAIEDAYACSLIKNCLRNTDTIDFAKIEKLKKKQCINLSITENDYFQYMSDSFDSKVCNAFSYFVALDLIEIYNKDKEKGLDLFTKVSKLSGNDPKKELDSIGINFMSDNSKNFKKHIKALKKTH